MKKFSKLLMAALMLVTVFALTGCGAKEVEVNLADYVKYTYEGYDGLGTGSAEIDARKIAKDIEEEIGDEKASEAQRKLKKVEVTLAKTENLSNGESVAVSFGEIKADELKEECGVIVKYEDFETKVSGLDELEEVDLFGDYEVKFSGNDTLGYGYVNNYHFPEGVYGVYLQMDKRENLSNGEKVKLQVLDYDDGDPVKTLAQLGKKAKALELEITVSGLTELTEYDIFQGLEMNYEGLNGQATATMRFDYNVNDYYYNFEFSMDKETELSNGDVITITCDMDEYYKDDYADVQALAAQRGIKLKSTTTQITVEGILAPISDVAQIDSAAFEQMKADDIAKIKDIYTEGYEKVAKGNSFLDAKYIGSYITFKNSNYYDYPNKIYNVYKCDIKYADIDPVWVYWCTIYTTDRDETTNQYTLSEIEAVSPAEYYKYYAYSDDFGCFEDENGNIFLGFASVDDAIEAFTDNYNGDTNADVIFNNITDTEEPHSDGTVAVAEELVIEENPDATNVIKENDASGFKVRVYDEAGIYTSEEAEAIAEKAFPVTDYCEVLVYVINELPKDDERTFLKYCDKLYETNYNKKTAVIYMIDGSSKIDFIYTNNTASSIYELQPPMDDVPASLLQENPSEYTEKIFETLISAMTD